MIDAEQTYFQPASKAGMPAPRLHCRHAVACLFPATHFSDGPAGRLVCAVDNVVHSLQRRFNRELPIVFNTYQCYLKDSISRLTNDMERARREGWKFACKLVRGAYMEQERRLAQEVSK
jgi:hypothetical protein